MIANLKQWEGQLVNGEFPLQRSLGGSAHSAVFLVEKSAGAQSQTAIRFIDADSEDASDQLKRWEAAKLSHRNLIRIFKTGRCHIDGRDLLYALTEFAEEDLSQILPERALTADETRQVLEAVLAALTYIHGQGLVHGSLKPSNVLAVNDTVKISSDTLRPAGEPAPPRESNAYDAPELQGGTLAAPADIWSLGVTLTEALTQRLPVLDSELKKQPTLPAGIKQPFREIIENCLQTDPARRWTVAQIATRLRGEKAEGVGPGPVAVPSTQAKGPVLVYSTRREAVPARWRNALGRFAKWPYAVALVAAVVAAVVLIARPKPPASPAPVTTAQKKASNMPSSAPEAADEETNDTADAAASAESRSTLPEAGVVRVMPEILPRAQRSIRGRIRVAVKVDVDASGNVTRARLRSSVRSRYFARQSLAAAKGWKFKPPVVNGQPVSSQWLVQFVMSRHAVNGWADEIKP